MEKFKMNTLTIIGIIAGVLSTILLILGQSQSSNKDKNEIIDSGQKACNEQLLKYFTSVVGKQN